VLRYRWTVIGDIRNRLTAAPFLPFVVHTTDGRQYPVPTPDHAHVYPSGGRVSIYTDDDNEFILPALHISGIAIGSNGRKQH
jgi:hypothetical protein